MTIEKTAFLVRTHERNLQTQRLVDCLRSNVSPNTFVVCDETKGVLDYPDATKVSLSKSVLADWQFKIHPRDWGWLCGDYCYYAAANQLSGYDYFCLIESDVFLSDAGAKKVKAILQGNKSDAVAADLRRFDRPRKFSKPLAQIGEDTNYGCIFPFTRVSAELVPEMFSLRRRVQNHHLQLRVNDEAILSTAAHKGSFDVTDLYDYVDIFHRDYFDTNPPHLHEIVEKRHDDTLVVHPSVPMAKIYERIQGGQKGYLKKNRLRKILATSPEHVGRALSRTLDRAKESPVRGRVNIDENNEKTERLVWLIDRLEYFQPVKIVDVGANPIEGDPSYLHLLAHGQAEVVGFEPNPEAHQELLSKAASNETYHCLALGDGGQERLFLTRHSGFSSLFQPDLRSATYLGFKRPMQITDVESISTDRLDDLGVVPPIDFLKIDIQGGELNVISNARNKLAEAMIVQTEVRFFPLYEKEPTFGDLERELRDQGFIFHSFDFLKPVLGSRSLRTKFRRRAFSQIVDGDAFFIRDLRTLQSFSDEQLSKLCILADSVVGAFDLASLCLEEFVRREKLTLEDVEKYLLLLPKRFLR